MRFAETELEHLLADDRRDHAERQAAIARHAHDATRRPSVRRRAAVAVIGFGIRLAGDQLTFRDRLRLVSRPS
jgi:hypothetical protein